MSLRRGLAAYETQVLGITVNPQQHQQSSGGLDEKILRLDAVLDTIQTQRFKSLGEFLVELFTAASDRKVVGKPQRLTQMASSFLNGRSETYTVVDLVDSLYHSRFSAPRAIRDSQTPNSDKYRPDEENMARHKLQQWAIGIVETLVDSEADTLSAMDGGLRLNAEMTWDFARGFSLQSIITLAQSKTPTCMRLLAATAIPRNKRAQLAHTALSESSFVSSANTAASPTAVPCASTSTPLNFEAAPMPPSQPVPSGQGRNRRDPWIIIIVAFMMLLNARNLRFTAFQKLIGVWLFANSAARGVYDLLGRIGLSTAYSTVLDVLRDLAGSARETVRTQAIWRNFLLVYDNINRQRRVWDPELGQRDVMDSGTAAALVILDDCDVAEAFDVDALERARAEKRRNALNVDVLYSRIDWNHLGDVMAVHVVSYLVQELPQLAFMQHELNNRLRTDLAKHRMKKGRRTQVFPLATSEHDEGSTAGNKKVLDDLMMQQLGLQKEEIEHVLTIVTGDQSTIEKIRTLKKFLESCPHGYARYGWVLPLIQLWHMGWADLERILATHWGLKTGSESDISTFTSINELLGRKVKNVKRPDYYPAQALVFDTLCIEVLDCWREYYGVENLELLFEENLPSLEQLLAVGRKIVYLYMTTGSSEDALTMSDASGVFSPGKPWTSVLHGEAATKTPCGDQVLANTILRMRDSMLHYEFHSSIADGDIGRALNVMAVWTFTFCSSGKSKYTNELLELTCNFEYEYSSALKTAIMNNWLCNLTGEDGHWFPMDLFLEHNINLLKSMSSSRDAPFSANFFAEVISLNIRYFLDVKESLRSSVGIGAKGGRHRKKKKAVAMKVLAHTMQEHELHRFRPRRTHGFVAQDDFAIGYSRFQNTSRIADFVKRTVVDGDMQADDNIQADVDVEAGMEDDLLANVDRQLPRAQVWENGELILEGSDSESDSDLDDDNL